MTETTVGTATAAPGEIATGRIEVTAMAGGASLGIPVIVINGAREGPCLWIDGVIHGDEPEGTLMCHLLRREVDPATLAGSLVLVPVMNTRAFEASRRGNPLDTFSYDMNRIYPGRPNGYLTERVAHAHKEWLVEVADMNIAVHSGGEHSYLSEMIFVTDHPGSQELARAMGGRSRSFSRPRGPAATRWGSCSRRASPASRWSSAGVRRRLRRGSAGSAGRSRTRPST